MVIKRKSKKSDNLEKELIKLNSDLERSFFRVERLIVKHVIKNRTKKSIINKVKSIYDRKKKNLNRLYTILKEDNKSEIIK